MACEVVIQIYNTELFWNLSFQEALARADVLSPGMPGQIQELPQRNGK